MGPNVSVEKFEGESSGLTSRKDIKWEIGEDITFIVSGQYDGVSVRFFILVYALHTISLFNSWSYHFLLYFRIRLLVRMVHGLVLVGTKKIITKRICWHPL